MTAIRLLLAVFAAVLLTGCGSSAERLANGDDPLAALRAPVRSSRYDGGFWGREATADSALWRDAVAWCRTPGNSPAPNCQTVGLVLSTLELERAAREAKRQLERLADEQRRVRRGVSPTE